MPEARDQALTVYLVTHTPCATARHLAQLVGVSLDTTAGPGVVMKQPRETAPIWVWLAFGLMGLGVASYVAGYMVLEDILGFLK